MCTRSHLDRVPTLQWVISTVRLQTSPVTLLTSKRSKILHIYYLTAFGHASPAAHKKDLGNILSHSLMRMRSPSLSTRWLVGIPLLAALTMLVSANDVLTTTGFTTCMVDSDITVTALNIQYDRTTQQITFDVAGISSKLENVSAALHVTAYGKQVYQKTFNPCDEGSKVDQLCPGEILK